MRFLLGLLLFVGFITPITAQVYEEGGKTRHRFAQLELGIEQRYLSARGTQSWRANENGTLEQFKLNNEHETRLIIGGTHFWGHADFYMSVQVSAWQSWNFNTGLETGARYYPWRIRDKKIRPFVGFSVNPTHYHQGAGVNQRKTIVPLHAGITYNRGPHLFDLSLSYNNQNTLNYYIDKEEIVGVKVHPLWITLGYKVFLETTLGAEKNWLKGKTQTKTEELAEQKKLNNFSIALGPSSTRFLEKSEHNTQTKPYLHHPEVEKVFLDLGIGYYVHKPDIHLNLAYRNFTSSLSAYGSTQTISRSSLALEGYKFLFDYHGFVPFIGPLLSWENIDIDEYTQQVPTANGSLEGIRPGIVMGWDIRPTRLQTWLLRTNVRYFPNMTVPMSSGHKYAVDQLEINFIQLVLYPERIFLKR